MVYAGDNASDLDLHLDLRARSPIARSYDNFGATIHEP